MLIDTKQHIAIEIATTLIDTSFRNHNDPAGKVVRC